MANRYITKRTPVILGLEMNRIPIQTPIMQHTSAIIKGLIGEADALKKLNHKSLKGQLRELLATRLLAKLLTIQFGIGSGVIINQLGMQSPQTDIIIYDRRILPPFIEEQRIGLYPAECVLATIEVKSQVTKAIIGKYAKSAQVSHDQLYDPLCSHYRDYDKIRPFCCLFGFNDNDICKGLGENEKIYDWMMKNAKPLFGVCVLNKFSWLNVMRTQGALTLARDDNEETKAFMAPLLDNIRTHSQKNYSLFIGHNDWFSIYTRNQNWTASKF